MRHDRRGQVKLLVRFGGGYHRERPGQIRSSCHFSARFEKNPQQTSRMLLGQMLLSSQGIVIPAQEHQTRDGRFASWLGEKKNRPEYKFGIFWPCILPLELQWANHWTAQKKRTMTKCREMSENVKKCAKSPVITIFGFSNNFCLFGHYFWLASCTIHAHFNSGDLPSAKMSVIIWILQYVNSGWPGQFPCTTAYFSGTPPPFSTRKSAIIWLVCLGGLSAYRKEVAETCCWSTFWNSRADVPSPSVLGDKEGKLTEKKKPATFYPPNSRNPWRTRGGRKLKKGKEDRRPEETQGNSKNGKERKIRAFMLLTSAMV